MYTHSYSILSLIPRNLKETEKRNRSNPLFNDHPRLNARITKSFTVKKTCIIALRKNLLLAQSAQVFFAL